MQVILLERIGKLGQMGETVTVKDGYARNYLLPTGKALRANEANKARFEAERAQLEARDLERKTDAQTIADKLEGLSLIVIRSAGETGQLYGSVSTRDIAADLETQGFNVARNQIELNTPIKTIGLHGVSITLHPEVSVDISINVARSADEAERQAAGEDMTQRNDSADEEEALAVEDVFEEGAQGEEFNLESEEENTEESTEEGNEKSKGSEDE